MKRLLYWAFAVFIFAACTEDVINEQDIQSIVDDAPETLTVGFEENDTRIQLNEATKTVWTKDDLVSVFYRSNANQKWQYQGETGERVGNLKRLEMALVQLRPLRRLLYIHIARIIGLTLTAMLLMRIFQRRNTTLRTAMALVVTLWYRRVSLRSSP